MSYFKDPLVLYIIILSSFVILSDKIFIYWMFAFLVMACQSVTSGMFKNIFLLNTKFPGLLPYVVCRSVRMACMAIDSASSMQYLALVRLEEVHHAVSFVKCCPLFDASVHILH
jgi:hypothetical protein